MIDPTGVQVLDPLEYTATDASMLDDAALKAAIQMVRIRSLTQSADLGSHTTLRVELEKRFPMACLPWPVVDYRGEVGVQSVWAVDDGGKHAIVIGVMIWWCRRGDMVSLY